MIRSAIAVLASISSVAALAQKPVAVKIASQTAAPLQSSVLGTCEMTDPAYLSSLVQVSCNLALGVSVEKQSYVLKAMNLTLNGKYEMPVGLPEQLSTDLIVDWAEAVALGWKDPSKSTGNPMVYRLRFAIPTPTKETKVAVTLKQRIYISNRLGSEVNATLSALLVVPAVR